MKILLFITLFVFGSYGLGSVVDKESKVRESGTKCIAFIIYAV